ncbi:MAG: acyl-CoA/acyl-ACP dehydrogenase [Actinomycetota bacterium]|nr:acyl-CoA/acyl-ACP dehydrogenase [Actinomycetota bacterium]
MDFAFSEEQEMLRSQARTFLSDRFGPDRVVALAESSDAPTLEATGWRDLAELGWIGLSASEDEGGGGMSFLDEAILFEELGRALYPGPYFSSVALALPALAAGKNNVAGLGTGERAATLAWAEPSGPYLLDDALSVSTKAEPTDGSWTLSGEKHLVPDLGAATDIVVVAAAGDGIGLWLVDRASLAESRVLSTMDATRRLGSLVLSNAPAELLVAPGSAEALLAKIRLRAQAALALEAVGIANKVLELSIAYVSERKQFDKPIGSYQAVSHPVADTYVDTELARSLAYWAAWCVSEDDEQAPVAAAAAKSFAGEAAVTACERSIQVHGGIGFTWEHILHRYYKRAQWIQAFDGSGDVQRKVLAAHLLD